MKSFSELEESGRLGRLGDMLMYGSLDVLAELNVLADESKITDYGLGTGAELAYLTDDMDQPAHIAGIFHLRRELKRDELEYLEIEVAACLKDFKPDRVEAHYIPDGEENNDTIWLMVEAH